MSDTCACPECDSARIWSRKTVPQEIRFRCRDCKAIFAIPLRREPKKPLATDTGLTAALQRTGTEDIIPDNPSRGTPGGRSLRDIYGIEP